MHSIRASLTWLAAIALAVLVYGAGPVAAVQPDEILKDAALEQRARSISAELRCLVCQNQSIDDSDAPLARDLRLLVRERLTAGDSDADVRAFLVARYGDFVLLKPPFKAHTLLLWFIPLIALALSAFAARAVFRRDPGPGAAERGLSADEEARLAKVLAGSSESEAKRKA